MRGAHLVAAIGKRQCNGSAKTGGPLSPQDDHTLKAQGAVLKRRWKGGRAGGDG